MKKIILIFCLLTFGVSWGQNDTMYFNDEIEMTDFYFGLLDSNIYGKSLINRAVNSGETVIQQLKGNYNQTYGIMEWADIFNATSLSYKDHSNIPTIPQIGEDISNYFGQLELEHVDKEEAFQPFSLILNTSSYIDSVMMQPQNFENINGQLSPIIDENLLYKKIVLKCAALLEFYPDNGYYIGNLVYNPNYIITSNDITIQSIEINVQDGNGFQVFNESNPIITYDRTIDSTVAQVRVVYTKNDTTYTDRLNFYLTTNSNLPQIKANGSWDDTQFKNPILFNGLAFKLGIKYGCGNEGKIRRPIIIAPPYRPTIQLFSMQKYWDQFNIGGLLESYAGLGYDVIWVKELPGIMSLQTCGKELAALIKDINELKGDNYPDEDWETIVMGYSKGGQSARYALKLLEKEHMDNGGSHPHTRVYIPFDSPHHGANIPLFAQAVYSDFWYTNILAFFAYISLIDPASTDMGGYSITASTPPLFIAAPLGISMTPHPHPNAAFYQNVISNYLNHSYTPTDTRKSFPTFCRNVAVSTGSYKDNYTTYFGWGLTPGMLLFKQHAPTYNYLFGLVGMANRKLWASKYSSQGQKVYRRFDIYYSIVVGIPFVIFKSYKFKNAYEWDMAQGGYKDNFYDRVGGPIPILRSSTFGLGTKIYDKSIMFLPLVSALAINPSYWQNNNLYYNLQDEDMFYNGDTIPNSNTPVMTDNYGYPHLGHPNNHFNITPFEAVYADKYIWDHIVFSNTLNDYGDSTEQYFYTGVGQNELNEYRDFLNDEVEAWDNWLQNKIVGNNHVINSNYEYKAWYKARGTFKIGHNVTPKTNPGDYIIKSTGNITVYAKEAVHITTGFHAQAGSKFHAFIQDDNCALGPFYQTQNPNNNPTNFNAKNEQSTNNKSIKSNEFIGYSEFIELYPNPNSGQFTFKVTLTPNINATVIKQGDITSNSTTHSNTQANATSNSTTISGGNTQGEVTRTLSIYTLNGQKVYTQSITQNTTQLNLNLKKGVYLLVYNTPQTTKTLKLIIQ